MKCGENGLTLTFGNCLSHVPSMKSLVGQGVFVFASVKKLLAGVFSSANSTERILQSFELHRQELRNSFFAQAAASGRPRGLQWKHCDWLDTFALVFDTESGMHTLFCGVNLSFTAVEGGDMEGVEAVSMIRDGSAVFHYQKNRWGSGGRVLFNLDPQMAAQTMANGQVVLKQSA